MPRFSRPASLCCLAATILGFLVSGSTRAQVADSIPPSITILPQVDSVHDAQLAVEVDFSDQGTLNPNRRNITLNGFPVTGLIHTGSGGSYSSTGTVALEVGANTLEASICDTFGNCTSASHTWYYRPWIYSVSVTPSGGWAQISASTTRNQAFTVTNTGETNATYMLSAGCVGAVFTSQCAVAPSSVTLAPGAQQNVTGSFTSGMGGTTGTMRVTASLSGNAAVQEDGWFDFEVARSAPTQSTAFAAIADPNPGSSIERSLCLTVAAGSGAYECADLRLVHSLPGVRTMNRSRAPVLIYNSAHSRPYPVVAVDVNRPSNIPTGDSIVLVLRVNGLQRARGTWPATQWDPAGETRRIAVGFDATNDGTGLYPYTVQVTRWAAGSAARDTTLAGTFVVVNRRSSAFRAGWWLAGLEQLFLQADGSRLWVGGDGSTRLYTSVGANAWRAEKLDSPDSLSYDPGTITYTRWIPGGSRVVFDGLGRHVRTINRLNQATTFAYTGNRLDSISMPVRSGAAPTFRFQYDGSDFLTGVDAPPLPGQARHVGASWTTNGGLSTLTFTDPAGATVAFAYDNQLRVNRRTNSLGHMVEWTFDAGSRLASTRVYMKGITPDTADLVTSYTNQETLGMPGTVAFQVTYYARTSIDGPRNEPGITDITRFYLGRFGNPWMIRDATALVTTIEYRDPNYPVLPTAVTRPSGYITRATYDSRGNVTTTAQVNPYADGRSGVTRYTYDDPSWPDFPTRIVNPAGDSMVMAYDIPGNRIWVQDGRGDSTRVTFGYDAFGAVTSVRSARAAAMGENPSQMGYDSVSGNLTSETTPLGFVSHFRQDAIGQDTAQDTPVDGVRVVRSHHWYDVRGLDTLTVTYGDTIEGDLGLHTAYNLEGQPWFVTRWSTRGSTDTLARRVEYDRGGRVINETQENGTLTYLDYDHAGNVIRSRAPRSAVTITTFDVLNRPTLRISSPEDYGQAIRYLQAGTGQTIRVDTFPNPAFATSPGHFTIPADTVAFAYDPLTGGMVRADNRSAWIRRTYYPNGQLATDTLRTRTWAQTGAAGEFDAHVFPLAHTYDLNGRRISLRHPGSIAPRNGATNALYDLEQYGYEPGSGALAWVRGVLGTEYRFYYDADLRTDSIGYPGQRGIGLTYDADGRLLRRVDGAWNFSTPGTFHAIHDITVESYDQRGKARTIRDTYRYDQTYSLLGSLTEFKGLGGHVNPGENTYTTYRVDALGHRMVESRFGASTETIYDYDEYGRMQGAHPPDGYTFSAGSAPLQQVNGYDPAGNQEWFTQQNFPTRIVDATRSFFDGEQRLVATDRQTCYVESIGGSPPLFACRNKGNLNNATSGAFEWYRYDALGRRILARTRRDQECQNAACASTITRFVWDGDEILYEIRAEGGNVSATQLEDDNAQGPSVGRVAYTHGSGIDAPLEIIRIGYTPSADAAYGLSWWNGPYPIMPYSDWHGVMDGATTATGTRIPCNTTPNLCSTGIWPASNLGAFYEPSAPADRQAWFGSLTSGKTDASGFMYKRNRYYNPQTGTFTQPDPIGLAGGMNVYGFADGDPVSYDDPYGLSACCVENQRQLAVDVEAMEYNGNHPKETAALAGLGVLAAAGGVVVLELGAASATAAPAVARGVTLAERAREIHGAVSAATQRRTTIAAARVVTAEGRRETWIASSERVLRPVQRAMIRSGSGERAISGSGHAEQTLVNAIQKARAIAQEIAASRPICGACANAIRSIGARIGSILK